MGKKTEAVAMAIIAILVVAVVVLGYLNWKHCDELGGVAVRTLTGMECIKRQ